MRRFKLIEYLYQKFKYHETIIVFITQILFAMIVLLRLLGIARKAVLWDLRTYIKTANLIYCGISPYNPDIYLQKLKVPPVQSPAMSLITMPLIWVPEKILSVSYIFCSIIATFIFIAIVFRSYNFNIKDHLQAKFSNVPLYFVLMLLCIASPVTKGLLVGQNAIFTALCLFMAMLYPEKDKTYNFILLGIGAAMKYSLLTFIAPVLIFQKRLWMSIAAFILFSIMILSVGLWLNGIFPAFLDYIHLVVKDTQQGFNSYKQAVHFDYLYIGFFKNEILNLLLKILVIILYFIVILKIWIRGKKHGEGFPKQLSAIDWALFTSITMFISYHRHYDGVLFIPFLGVVFLDFFSKMHIEKHNPCLKIKTLLIFFYLLFWILPNNIVFPLSANLGKYLSFGEKFIYYSKYNNFTLFPIYSLAMFSMIIYLTWLEFSPLFEKAKQ